MFSDRNALIKKSRVTPGRIFSFKLGVKISLPLEKNILLAPPSVILSSEEKIISSQPSSNAEFIDITLPSNDVDLIEHLFHLISSTIIETTGLVLGVIFVA